MARAKQKGNHDQNQLVVAEWRMTTSIYYDMLIPMIGGRLLDAKPLYHPNVELCCGRFV